MEDIGMIPILYSETEVNYLSNGIGPLTDSILAPVTEERNGVLELELEYPANGPLFKELREQRVILAKPNDKDTPHAFRIYEIKKTLQEQTVVVYASTKTNDLGANLVPHVAVEGVTAQVAMNAIKNGAVEPINMNFISDIQTLSSSEWTHLNPLNCISGTDGSVISRWGGEIKRTNDAIYLYSQRGDYRVTSIRPGKNIEGLEMTVSTKGLITSIIPFVYYDSGVDDAPPVLLNGTQVDSAYVMNYPIKYIRPIDYSSYEGVIPELEEGQARDEAWVAQILSNLNAIAATYFTVQYPGADKPSVTIEVDMIQISESSEYNKYKELEHIGVCDTVDVWVEKFDIDVEVKINKIEYESISEKVLRITAGTQKNSLYQSLSKEYESVVDEIKDYVDTMENGIYNTIRLTADGQNRIFSGYTTPDESLVKDGDLWYKPMGDGVVNMYRWVNGGWALALTSADNMVVGTLDASNVNIVNLNADNMSVGELQGAKGAWDLDTGDFWLGSSRENASFVWNGASLVVKISSGETFEEAIDNITIRTTPTEIVNTFITEYGKDDEKVISKGIISLSKYGVNVGQSGSNINSSMLSNAFEVSDGDATISAFGEAGAVIPRLNVKKILSLDVVQPSDFSGNAYVDSGGYSSLQHAIDSLFSDNRKYLKTGIIINVGVDTTEDVNIKGLMGARLTIKYVNGANLYGSIRAEDCSNMITIYGSGGRPKISGAYTAMTFVNCSSVYLGWLDLSASTVGVWAHDNSKVYCNSIDTGQTYHGFISDTGSIIQTFSCRGSGIVALEARNGGVFITTDSVPQGLEKEHIISHNKSKLASGFSTPPVTSKTFERYFTTATFDTLHNGGSVDSYYGSTGAQNRWTGMSGWKLARIRMGGEVAAFIAGGTGVQIQMRLHRKDSSHGYPSSAIPPTPSNFSCSMTGAIRNGWTGWGVISSSYFGSSVDLRLGSNTYSNYAIWDGIEVWAKVTKNI